MAGISIGNSRIERRSESRDRILVTGGAGFIGSHLVDRLVADGAEVVVLDNLRRGRRENLAATCGRVEFVQGDVRNAPLVSSLSEGVRVVYHLAAESSVMRAEKDIDYTFSTNVCGMFNVLKAAHETGVARVVFTSSREVYGDAERLPVPEVAPTKPKNIYGSCKAAAELCCRAFQTKGLDVRVLRLANAYGPRDFDRVIPNFLEQALSGRPLVLFGGDQVLDFVWIDVVVEALVRSGNNRAMDSPVNIGSGVGTTVTDLATRVLAETGSKSSLYIHNRRDLEVDRFVADTARMLEVLSLHPDEDPLGRLASLVHAKSNGRSGGALSLGSARDANEGTVR